MAIEGAHRAGKPIGICGQAPSDFPEFAEWLVEEGISSISLNPDTVLKTTARIAACEQRLGSKIENRKSAIENQKSAPVGNISH